MPIAVANFAVIYSRVVMAINAAPTGVRPEFANGDADIDDDAHEYTIIRDAIIAADLRRQRWHCRDVNSPHRARYLEFSTDLTHGAEISDAYGPHGAVQIKQHAGAGDYSPGIDLLTLGYTPAEAVNAIIEWRANDGNIFGAVAHNAAGSPLSFFYVVVGKRLYFTGHVAQVEQPTFSINRAANPPVLGSPEADEQEIVAEAVAFLTVEADGSEVAAIFTGLRDMTPQP